MDGHVEIATGSKIGRKDDRYVFNFYFRLLAELELGFRGLFEFPKYIFFVCCACVVPLSPNDAWRARRRPIGGVGL